MLDHKGPEYRIKTFENGKIMLNDGDEFSFTTEDIVGDQSRVSVTYAGLVNDISIGDRILVNNGLVIFEVIGKTDTDVKCKVLAGGELSNRKSLSFPNKVLNQVYLSEQDQERSAVRHSEQCRLHRGIVCFMQAGSHRPQGVSPPQTAATALT
jgi:Pyruvate kinase